MESARMQREKGTSEPVGGDRRVRPNVAAVFRPLILNDVHSPAFRLGDAFGPYTPSSHVLQTKLSISEPGDQYEQEADRVAEQVMRMPDPSLRLQRKCACGGANEECAECSKPLVQRQANSAGGESLPAAPDIVHETLRGSAQRLDPSTRSFMESRFGQDFSH